MDLGMNFWRDLCNAPKSWFGFIWFLDEHVNHIYGRAVSRRLCSYCDRLLLDTVMRDTEWVVK
jgi:hypothetical protein